MFEALLADIRKEFPDFKIVSKSDSWFMKVLSWLLLIVTFGSQKTFMTKFITTFGNTIYVPKDWESVPEVNRVGTLRHERVHLRQQVRYGRVLFTFLYLVPFFPLFFAYGRAKLEMEAYSETILAVAELKGLDKVRSKEFRDHIASHFVTGSYGWMWIFRKTVDRWIDEAIEKAVKKVGETK